MLWPPTVSVEVVKTAMPPEAVIEPRVAVPSMKVMVPVGLPPPGPVTLMVAVKDTLWPKTDGLPEPTRATVVEAMLTVWDTVFDAGLATKLVSPL